MPAIITGITKGFIEQVMALASIFVGVWASFRFSLVVGGWLNGFIQADQQVINIIAFAVIVMTVVFVLMLLAKLLSKTLDLVMLGWLNRLLGVVFAILKAALVLGLLIFLLDPINDKTGLVSSEVLDKSVLYNLLHGIATEVFPYLKDLLLNA